MAEVKVTKHGVGGAYQTSKFDRSRYEKAEVAYGFVAADKYALEDTLVFSQVNAKEIIHAKLQAAGGAELELFNGTNIDNPVQWEIDSATPEQINYVIHYVRGAGGIDDGSKARGEGATLKVVVREGSS